MTRAESLAFVVSVMPPGYARDVIRAALKGWPAEDVDAWHRLKDNERKQAKRDATKAANVRSDAARQTGQVPVAIEEENRTSSGLVRGDKPDIEQKQPPSPPQVSPTPPSFPAPAPVHTQVREEQKFLPDGSSRKRPSTEQQVVAHCVSLELPPSDGKAIWAKWEGNGFTNNGKPMKNWHQTVNSWMHHGYLPSQRANGRYNGHSHDEEPAVRRCV